LFLKGGKEPTHLRRQVLVANKALLVELLQKRGKLESSAGKKGLVFAGPNEPQHKS
jgi:hypothetical protein